MVAPAQGLKFPRKVNKSIICLSHLIPQQMHGSLARGPWLPKLISEKKKKRTPSPLDSGIDVSPLTSELSLFPIWPNWIQCLPGTRHSASHWSIKMNETEPLPLRSSLSSGWDTCKQTMMMHPDKGYKKGRHKGLWEDGEDSKRILPGCVW